MSQRSCFLIDDDEDDREIFAMALKKANADFVCSMAKNGRDALDIVANSDFVPNYIFIDLNMPMVSGRDCLSALKKVKRFEGVPIIVYTTSSHSTDINDTKKLGADHYLVKPTSIVVLSQLLNDVFTKNDLPFLLTEVN